MVDGPTSSFKDETNWFKLVRPHQRKSYLQPVLAAYLRDSVIRMISILRMGKLFTLLARIFSGSEPRKAITESRSPALLLATKIAVFAHYSGQVEISTCDAYFISQLKDSGFAVIVSTTCTDDPIEHQQLWNHWHDKIDGLITRENIGFDFGSWAAALTSLDLENGGIEQIILVNNSVYGPLFPLGPIISDLSLRGDFFGLTASREFCPHIQSYFLGFNKIVIDHSGFRKYWRGSFLEQSKWSTIFRRELAWEVFFTKQGFRSAVFIQDSRQFPRNPLTFLWKDLIYQGFPFMKKSLLTHNYDSIDMTGWEDFITNNCPNYDVSLIPQDSKH